MESRYKDPNNSVPIPKHSFLLSIMIDIFVSSDCSCPSGVNMTKKCGSPIRAVLDFTRQILGHTVFLLGSGWLPASNWMTVRADNDSTENSTVEFGTLILKNSSGEIIAAEQINKDKNSFFKSFGVF